MKPNGKLAETDDIQPVPSNFFMNALFEDVSLSLNDIQIEGGSSIYPYKATIESALNFGDDAKRIQLLPAGFFSDENERHKWIEKSKTCPLVGALRIDLFNQPKYLIPGVNARIRLTRSSSDFCLHLFDGVADAKEAKC